ncbi:MAG TPA: glutamate synthase [Bacteroidota bacterium]|nr:glutamate synthase [Bacteroidota bacterium]
MAELVPISFSKLLKRCFYEYEKNDSIFDLPVRKFYCPRTDVDLSVKSCGHPAANPVGPAAGPHTQLAQNIVLSWLAGARIIELKTVQANDRLSLSRPCIDMATIGYNTEWSQELRLEESAREYVKASMIVEILKRWLVEKNVFAQGANLDTVIDVSVGYDLAGIQSPRMRQWLNTMQNASVLIEGLRKEIPEELKHYRDLSFTTKISDSITLSTFHGTPANEIERICEFLIGEMNFHVVVKMNPPMLGKKRLEYLLHKKLGYINVEVNPNAYNVNINFDDAVGMMKRLQSFAAQRGKTVGVKFGNTLEVVNKGTFLKEQLQYLSGQPLHVLHLALVHEWRNVFGAEFPVSFSAGVDANNFSDCVALGLVPITVCTDLLRPGGYGRLPQYLINLEKRMKLLGAKSIHEYIVLSSKEKTQNFQSAVIDNTSAAAARSRENSRYHSSNNQKAPRKIGSHLQLWDCISCDKCIPVCPNDANFFFEVEPFGVNYKNIEITEIGWKEITGGVYSIEKRHQIGNYADACNECGNCDVFCPEDGGPYIVKPRFFGSRETYNTWKTQSGFVLLAEKGMTKLLGRFKDDEYELSLDSEQRTATWENADMRMFIDWNSNRVVNAMVLDPSSHAIADMQYYFAMAALLKGILNASRVHFVTMNI